MTATLRFMDSPATTGTVRLDLNPDRLFYPADLDPGVPSLEGDPDGVGVEYGFRTVSWTQVVRGSKMDALAAQSQLARELLRRENWLMFQVDPTVAPVWFKTYRTEPGSLSLEHVYEDGADIWQIGVTVTADPFAYGERVTLSEVTINNNPAAGTNPMSYVLPEILGDAPTPLVVALRPSAYTQGNVLVNAVSLDSGYGGPYVWQTSAFTAATDTSAEVANSSFSGGGYVEVSFATNANMTSRLGGILSPKPPRGRYKILLRAARSDTSSAFQVKFSRELTSGVIDGPTASLSGSFAATGWAGLLDLGDFMFGGETPEGVTDFTALGFHISAARTSGTGTLRLDYLLAIPLDVSGEGESAATITSSIKGVSFGSTGSVLYLDGENDLAAYGLSYGILAGELPPTAVGGFPMVAPGRTNALHLVKHVGGTPVAANGTLLIGDNNDSISTSTAVRVSYLPRYLYVGGS